MIRYKKNPCAGSIFLEVLKTTNMKSLLLLAFLTISLSFSNRVFSQVDSAKLENTEKQIARDKKSVDKMNKKIARKEKKIKRQERKTARRERKRDKQLKNIRRKEEKLEEIKKDTTNQ